MLQFYFLSVLLNIIAGLILVYGIDFNTSGLDGAVAKTDGDTSVDDSDDIFADEQPAKDGSALPFGKTLVSTSAAFLNDSTFRLTIGILAVLVGLIKLFYTVQNDVAVIGDFVPAIAGLAGGASILVEYYTVRSEFGLTLPSFFETLFFEGRKYLGVFCIIAGVLHFIFPRVLFL